MPCCAKSHTTTRGGNQEVFDNPEFDSYEHVLIHVSGDEDGSNILWLHTRGMRKFGGPDISIRGVLTEEQSALARVCNSLIEHQASGGIVYDGRPVRVIDPP